MGAITVSGLKYQNAGSQMKVEGQLTFSDSYATGGDVITIKQLGMSKLDDLVILDSAGYAFDFVDVDYINTAKIKVFLGAGGGTIGNEAAHTHAAGAITINGRLDLAVPAFSGSGFTTVGQVVTTTQVQTMTLNQCAGMWLVNTAQPTTPPVLILSNTAVTGAAAVLTVQGVAPATDVGAWQIVTLGTATATALASGAGSSHTHSSSGGASAEVGSSTNLSTLTVDFVAYGA